MPMYLTTVLCPAHNSHSINICSSINCWFSCPSSEPVLHSQGEPHSEKWSNIFIMLTSLGEKSSKNSSHCVILILYFITMVFWSPLWNSLLPDSRYIACCKVVIFDIRRLENVSIWNIVYLHSLAQNSLKCQYYVFMFLIELYDVTSIATSHQEVFWPSPAFGKVYYDNE